MDPLLNEMRRRHKMHLREWQKGPLPADVARVRLQLNDLISKTMRAQRGLSTPPSEAIIKATIEAFDKITEEKNAKPTG